MKIIIKPSVAKPGYHTFSADTMTDDDNTTQLVELLLDSAVFLGHDAGNVAEAAARYADERIIS